MALPKKTAVPAPKAALRQAPLPPVEESIDFGSPEMYVAGGGLPDGWYIWVNLQTQMHDGFGQKKQVPRLGVMLDLVPLDDPTAKPRQQFYSMGGNADKSFAPNATGKGLASIPGAPGITLNDSTNWALLRKSLSDCGLPAGVFTNDLSVLEGTWAFHTNVPEPAERAGYGSSAKTGEAEPEERKNQKVSIVGEIHDEGKPWEGTGGIPAEAVKAEAASAPAKDPIPAAKSALAAKAALKPKPAPKPEPEPEPVEATDEDIQTAGVTGVSNVLGSSPKGMSKLLLQTSTFRNVAELVSEEMAQAVLDTYFGDNASVDVLLGQVGYKLKGAMVVPI